MTETEYPNTLIQSGKAFLSNMCKHYGDERGLELWRGMGESMGPGFQNAILLDMLRGGTNKYWVEVRPWLSSNQTKFIEAIKDVRHVTGWGLKQAKDFMDDVRYKNYARLELTDEHDAEWFRRQMKNCGYDAT